MNCLPSKTPKQHVLNERRLEKGNEQKAFWVTWKECCPVETMYFPS